MKAYKCDMCGKYVEDVYVVSGICRPNREYYGLQGMRATLIYARTVTAI